MAWEKPITDWQAGDAPTADAFNRIEKNILDLKDNKRDKSSTVPVANGGTGATNAESARSNLGIRTSTLKIRAYYATGSEDATSASYSSGSEVEFTNIKIGSYTISSAAIYHEIKGNGWVRMKLSHTIISAVATAIKNTTGGYTPGCIVRVVDDYVYFGNDENDTKGFMVTVIYKN